MAVQFGSPTAPETVKLAGVASLAEAEDGDGVPLAQESETVTEAALLSEKSLWTLKLCWLRLLTMVQVAEPPRGTATLTQLLSSLV